MEIKVSKDIIINNGYNLRGNDFVTYLRLLFISEKINSNKLSLNHVKFKKLIMVEDNRTLKKIMRTLYKNNLTYKCYDKIPTKGSWKIVVNKINSDDYIKIDYDILKYLHEIKPIGIHLLCYLKSYIDETDNDYIKLIEYDTISKRLTYNKETVMNYIGYIR